MGIKWSEEQEKIFKSFTVGTRHIIIKAVAGSGKTTTGVECCRRDKKNDIAYVAFNKHIQLELERKINQDNVDCKTYHGLGLRSLKKALKNVEINEHKLDDILLKFVPGHKDVVGYLRNQTGRLVSLAKQYCVSEQAELERLVDHHTLEIRGIEHQIFDLVPRILRECRDRSNEVDFDDMVWLPRELGIKMKRYDIMLIDEAQDTNIAQQWLALESADRLVVIGDPNQAIYGFRGSDSQSIQRLQDALAKSPIGIRERTLSYTRRCPKSHVELANQIVPEIKALENAPEGEIKNIDPKNIHDFLKPGDLALCRTNAPLLAAAYALIKRNIKAVVRGRDIGNGVLKLMDKAMKRSHSNDIKTVLSYADSISRAEADKYRDIPNGRGENRAIAVMDKLECLIHIATEASSTGQVRARIESLFSDFEDDGRPKHAVVLGTVHRTKGLEANRVVVLRPDLIPFPAAKKGWEVQQERNLAYVAATRAMYNKENAGELIFCGGTPGIYKGEKTPSPLQESIR